MYLPRNLLSLSFHLALKAHVCTYDSSPRFIWHIQRPSHTSSNAASRFLNLNQTQTQQTQTQRETARILDGDSSINYIMDKACEDIYKEVLIQEVNEKDDDTISQSDPSNSTPAFLSYFNLLRIRSFCLCLTYQYCALDLTVWLLYLFYYVDHL
jgi:hypothetical protein